jgi:hypothetical protein
MTDAGGVGFVLTNNNIDHRRLNWLIESELVEVNRRGFELDSLAKKRRAVQRIQGGRSIEFIHQLSGRLGFYRIDIRFARQRSGKALGSYSMYLRVMPARTGMRMEIEWPTVLPGEYARATLVNTGTVPMEFSSWDYGYTVRRFDGARWKRVADNPPRRSPKDLRKTYLLPPGTENKGCIRYLVPSDQVPGLFRFSAVWRQGADLGLVKALFEVKTP